MVMVATLVVASGAALAVTRVGGPGNDHVLGTAGPDDLVGGHGSDRIVGFGGYDVMFGGGAHPPPPFEVSPKTTTSWSAARATTFCTATSVPT
jgi:hypothetical protein